MVYSCIITAEADEHFNVHKASLHRHLLSHDGISQCPSQDNIKMEVADSEKQQFALQMPACTA